MHSPHLFTPLTLRGLTLRNRVVLSPMCQYQADDGHVTDWHVAHHGHFSLVGLGLAFVEATGHETAATCMEFSKPGGFSFSRDVDWSDAGFEQVTDVPVS